VKVLLLLFVWLSAACISASAIPSQSAQRPSDVIVIKGATEPEKLPEYLIWRNAFDILSKAIASNRKLVLDSLKLASNDLQVTLKEAASEGVREQECKNKQDRVIEQAKTENLPKDKFNERLNVVVLACRYEVLDAKERLMTALTPDGRVEVERWVYQRRKGMTVYVQKHELEFFRKPR
jgi:hypothetical protein